MKPITPKDLVDGIWGRKLERLERCESMWEVFPPFGGLVRSAEVTEWKNHKEIRITEGIEHVTVTLEFSISKKDEGRWKYTFRNALEIFKGIHLKMYED